MVGPDALNLTRPAVQPPAAPPAAPAAAGGLPSPIAVGARMARDAFTRTSDAVGRAFDEGALKELAFRFRAAGLAVGEEGRVVENGRHHAYTCPTGRWTMGYGINLEAFDGRELRAFGDFLVRHRVERLPAAERTPARRAEVAAEVDRLTAAIAELQADHGRGATPGDHGRLERRDLTISDQEAFDWLNGHHLQGTIDAVRRHPEYGPAFGRFSVSQQMAIVDLAFQVGPGALDSFAGVRRAALAGDWQEAAHQMVASRNFLQSRNRVYERIALISNSADPSTFYGRLVANRLHTAQDDGILDRLARWANKAGAAGPTRAEIAAIADPPLRRLAESLVTKAQAMRRAHGWPDALRP